MATLLPTSAWAKFSLFRNNDPFLAQNLFITDFLVEFEIRASELTPVSHFCQIGQKIRELEIRPEMILKTA